MKVERKVWNSCRILTDYGNYTVVGRYERLTNLILSCGGRIHGSQYQAHTHDYTKDKIAVYFEIPIENKEEFLKEEKQ